MTDSRDHLKRRSPLFSASLPLRKANNTQAADTMTRMIRTSCDEPVGQPSRAWLAGWPLQGSNLGPTDYESGRGHPAIVPDTRKLKRSLAVKSPVHFSHSRHSAYRLTWYR